MDSSNGAKGASSVNSFAIAATMALAFGVIGGCATSYQAQGFTGGFSETMLAPDVVRIRFIGNAYTSGERAQDFALLRAAEVMLGNEFPYFAVLNETSDKQVGTYTAPGSSTTTGTVNTYGNYGTYTANTTYNPGQTYVFYKPESGLLVQGFNEKPTNVYAFDAAFIVKSLKTKYKI